jgi:hypothetical protein
MMSAAERATTAREVAGLALVALERPVPELGTAWDRAAVFLARQAIENAVAAAWLAPGWTRPACRSWTTPRACAASPP